MARLATRIRDPGVGSASDGAGEAAGAVAELGDTGTTPPACLPGWARFGHAPAWGAPTAWGAPPPAYGPYAAPPAPEQEMEFLKAQAGWLQQQLDGISQRITELEQEA